MNYKNLKNQKYLGKGLKSLTAFAALALVFAVIFYSPTTSSSSLPDCSTLSSGTIAQPGSNCLFFGKPLCKAPPSISYVVNSSDSSKVLPSNQIAIHRSNCYDLSDITLCNQLEEIGQQAISGKNCVKNCNDPSFSGSGIRGTDYAVHNRDCVRFCDNVSSENSAFSSSIVAANGSNCVARKCNQLPSGTAPSPNSNCSPLPCNILAINELISVDQKINSDIGASRTVGQYCNSKTDINDRVLKCYKFSNEQLPYVLRNNMCVIHNCAPSCSSYVATDDVNGDGVAEKTINSKDSNDTLNISAQGTAYTDNYIKYINGNYGLSSNSLCTPVICKPVIKKQYRCVTSDNTISGDDSKDTSRNQSCDATGDGSVCSNNYCYKTIDCAISSSAPECQQGDSSGDSIGSNDDTMDSWFYRPQPMKKATNGNGILREKMDSGLCYTKQQLQDNGWGEDAKYTVNLGALGSFTIDLGYFLTYLSPNRTQSPGLCNGVTNRDRGTGYPYLCGNSGNLYQKVVDYTAYYKGYVKSSFTEGDATHKVVLCLRFKNLMRPDDLGMSDSETCGKRECGITCGFDICKDQVCGSDVCRELTIKDSNPNECEMNEDLFANDKGGRECLSVVDTYLRLRIQKYNNKICGFLDVKGQLAYTIPWFADGSEILADGVTCVSGSGKAGSCGGKNTKDSAGLADRWRTIKFHDDVHIPYIQNNQPSDNLGGYLDKNGKLFKEQDCIKVPLRVDPPLHYILANTDNSSKLFSPQLYITNSMIKRGGAISTPTSANQAHGTTDFHYPEIEVGFGATTQKLSLGIGYNGFETETSDPLGSATISTKVNNLDYSAEVFVKKQFNSSNASPIFCLYQKLFALDNTELPPRMIECVDRNFPQIDNGSNASPQKLIISGDSSNIFNSAKIILRYLGGFGANNVNNNCQGDDSCTSETKLENINISTPTCNDSPTNDIIEGYKFCAQREDCNQLNNECMQNEIDIQAAKVAGQSTDSLLTIRKNCNEILLPMCNFKKGIIADSSASILNNNPTGVTSDTKAYGWFNELCFVPANDTHSFDNNLKQVIAYDPSTITGGVKGKCIVASNSPYLTDGNSSTNCNDGGKAPNCLCIESIEGISLDPGQVIRTQTQREAGLCIDIPSPQTCPAINYNPIPNPNDTTDPNYISSSLGYSIYGASQSNITGVVHISHKNRSAGVGNAEFPQAVFGMNSVEGQCRGFWKNADAANGFSSAPTRNCLNNGGTAAWDSTVNNPCVRYSCPQISTAGPYADGNYQGNYGSSETGEAKGTTDGFAMWPQYTKTNDFAETVSATSCIPGFKFIGATAITSNGLITGYSGGTKSSRICNQIGSWQSPTNICLRIACPAVNPPTSPSTNSDWAQWYDSGGATFSGISASRSSSFITAGSVQSGTCNNNLGFFQLGTTAPSRDCDYLGNWKEVSNKCATQCGAISLLADAKSSNNGNSYWAQVTTPLGVPVTASASSCISGYIPYPYPPLKNESGDLFTLSDSSPNYTTTIPLTVANDTRALDAIPKRMCKSVTSNGTTSNFWYPSSTSCINKCPGATSDSRIGVGNTQHTKASGTFTIAWPDATLGKWVYASNAGIAEDVPNFNGQNASNYSASRSNGFYMVARYCNSNGKWDDPIPQCVTNSGVISGSNATYLNSQSTPTTTHPRSVQTLDVGSTIGGSLGGVATSTTCSTGYFQKGKDTGTLLPISSYTCEYKDSNKKIDEVYFKYKTGDPCGIYCSLANNTNYSNATYTGNTGYYASGAKVNLSCKSGYGNAFGSGGNSTCGRNASDRSSTGPSITCQSGGSWSGVSNNCAACRSCNSSSPEDRSNIVIEGNGNCGTKTITVDINSLESSCGTKQNSESCSKTYSDSPSCKVTCNGGVGKCTRHTDVSGTIQITCRDNYWITTCPSNTCQ